MKPPRKSGEEEKKNMATIEAKPQIKNLLGDVTRFMPTTLKVKREGKDAKGRIKIHCKFFLRCTCTCITCTDFIPLFV